MSNFFTKRLVLIFLCAAALGLLRCPMASASPATVHRIHFAPGQRHLVIYGLLTPRHQQHDYLFEARTPRRLGVTLEDLPKGKNGLVSTYHITFPSGKQYGLKGYDPFSGALTETGRYRITVNVNLMASEARRGRFRLTLSR